MREPEDMEEAAARRLDDPDEITEDDESLEDMPARNGTVS